MRTCPYYWHSHGCDLDDGHDGDHECHLGSCDSTRPRGHEDVWRWGPVVNGFRSEIRESTEVAP